MLSEVESRNRKTKRGFNRMQKKIYDRLATPPFCIGQEVCILVEEKKNQDAIRPTDYRVFGLNALTREVGVCDGNDQEEGFWVPWDNVVLRSEFGWNWVRRALPAEVVQFLECFDGLDAIRLDEEIKNLLVWEIENSGQLYESVQDAVQRKKSWMQILQKQRSEREAFDWFERE